ncbi:hypothetical protein FORC065_3799 [Yersinia enterocolitica]|nr:hypothetical protein FORC065_3799 [Yersinia enterocolitica]
MTMSEVCLVYKLHLYNRTRLSVYMADFYSEYGMKIRLFRYFMVITNAFLVKIS